MLPVWINNNNNILQNDNNKSIVSQHGEKHIYEPHATKTWQTWHFYTKNKSSSYYKHDKHNITINVTSCYCKHDRHDILLL